MKKLAILFALLLSITVSGQSDQDALKTIYSQSLTNGKAYQWLDHLSNKIGGRLSGSASAEKAVQYTKSELEKLGLDKVWLQEVMVPKWERGAKEVAHFTTNNTTLDVNICALGGSVATSTSGLEAQVIEVKSFEELAELGEKVKGKIVFFNGAMNPELIHTFEAYGGCSKQRYAGAYEAGKLGAVGVIVRSLNLRQDDLPHTGSMGTWICQMSNVCHLQQ